MHCQSIEGAGKGRAGEARRVYEGWCKEGGTLVRRLWHSLQAVEARLILPSSEGPPGYPGGWPPPAPPAPPGGALRGAMGLYMMPVSPIAKEGPLEAGEEEQARRRRKMERYRQTSYQANKLLSSRNIVRPDEADSGRTSRFGHARPASRAANSVTACGGQPR